MLFIGAAESFVDDSIKSAKPFIHSNVVGTQVMVDLALKFNVERFIYISTDEVYGQLLSNEEPWTESSIVKPRNPYSASKAAGELIVRSASETHGLKYNITRCSNNYGSRQPPRNLIPKVVTCLLSDTAIPIHGNGQQHREWLYVLDHCSAVMKILENGKVNETYNIGSGFDLSNLEVVESIAKIMNKTPKINFITDRKGHDQKYGVNCNKIKEIGWKPRYINFAEIMESTIKWYSDNLNFYEYTSNR